VAEKTLFANFGSKERLYQATLEPATLLTLVLPEAIRTLAPVLDHPPDDLRAFLRAVIDNRLRFAQAHRREVKLLAQHLLTRPDDILAFGAAFQERVAPHVMPVVQHFVERGALRDDVPLLTLVRLIVTTAVGHVLTRVVLLPDLPWDDAREIDHLVSVLADGLVPREAAFAPAPPKAKRRARRAP
jgi:AcrR family transcriptional regulator